METHKHKYTQRHTQTQRQTHIQGVFFNWREQSGAVDLCECRATKVWKANKQMLFLRFIQNLKFKCKDFWRNSNSVEWSEQSGAVDLCECRAREARRADAPKVKPLLSAPKKPQMQTVFFFPAYKTTVSKFVLLDFETLKALKEKTLWGKTSLLKNL